MSEVRLEDIGSNPSRHCTCTPSVCTCEQKEQHISGDGYWWHVNKGGFPIPEETLERMWGHIKDVHPDGHEIAASIRGVNCKRVPISSPPIITMAHPVQHNLLLVQTYMQGLQYNHTGTQFFEIRKSRPLSRLMEIAKEMIQESLPIKCLEAVILSIYLTSTLTNLQRFTIGFKTKFRGMYYRHVVLGVHHNGSYGSLGLSRRKELMYKPLEYKSLSDVVQEFIQSYQKCHHQVIKIKFSPPLVHDITSCEPIQWKFFSVNLRELNDEELKKTLEKMSRTMRSMQ